MFAGDALNFKSASWQIPIPFEFRYLITLVSP